MDFYIILNEIMTEKGIGIADVARASGLTDSTVRSIIDRKQKKVALNIAFKLSEGLGVSLERLNGLPENKNGPTLSSEAMQLARDYDALDEKSKAVVKGLVDLVKANGPEPDLPAISLGKIRHYLTPAAAGYAAPIEGEDYELIDRSPDVPKGADFCIDITGDSMEPYIKDGSRVYVQRGDVEEMRDAGVFYVDGDVYVKQWCVDMIGTLHLLSANPKREDANIQIFKDSGRNVVCFGRVLLKKKLPEPRYR